MKRIVSVLIFFCITLLMITSVSAAVANPIEPMYEHIHSVIAFLSIDETSGLATCEGQVIAKLNVPVKVDVTLQRSSVNSFWETVHSWSSQGYANVCLCKSWYVQDGYVYRVYAQGYVYDATGTTVVDQGYAIKSVDFPK